MGNVKPMTVGARLYRVEQQVRKSTRRVNSRTVVKYRSDTSAFPFYPTPFSAYKDLQINIQLKGLLRETWMRTPFRNGNGGSEDRFWIWKAMKRFKSGELQSQNKIIKIIETLVIKYFTAFLHKISNTVTPDSRNFVQPVWSINWFCGVFYDFTL